MTITIPSTAQVVCSGPMLDNETWANVYHVSAEVGDFEVADAVVIMGLFRDYYDSVKARRTNKWSLTQITCRDIRTEGQETFQLNPTSVVGGSVGGPLPPQVAMVVTLRTAVNSRSGRGRTFLNGLLPGALSTATAQFSSTTVDNEAADFRDLCVDLVAADHPLVVTSRTQGLSRKVTSIEIDSKPDTQRRRVKEMVADYRRSYSV